MKSDNRQHAISFRFSALFLVATLSLGFMNFPLARCTGPFTVGLWHLDKVTADEYTEITPDETGINHGTLGGDVHPKLVEGKFGKALSFNLSSFVYVPISFLVGFPPTPEPIYIPISPNLNIQKEIKIEAWVNFRSFTNSSCNNIVVKCSRTKPDIESILRIIVLAVRPSVEYSEKGVIVGCLRTESGDFNEVVTANPVITLNKWTYVAFTRTASGIHVYVNGEEQDLRVLEGMQNPTGNVMNGTEVYIGHDSDVIIDEVEISDCAPVELAKAQIDIGNNLLIAVVVGVLVFAIAWVLRKAIHMWVIYGKSRD